MLQMAVRRAKSTKGKSTGKRKPAAKRAAVDVNAGPHALYVISDPPGNVPRHMLGASMTQFPRHALNVRFKSFVRTAAQLQEIFQQARAEKAAVCHAMVSHDLKREIHAFCDEAKLKC